MRYNVHIFDYLGEKKYNVTTTSDNDSFVGFPAEVGNPNYDQFLVDAKLTDKQIKALKPDVWYDFPEGDK
jgi:hypothetical protein